MHAHRDIPLDLDEIIDLFASLLPRRMRMANILCSDDFHFAMQLSFALNLNLTLVKNTNGMLNIIFKDVF